MSAQNDRREFDKALKRWLWTLAGGLVISLGTGLIKAGQIEEKVHRLEKEQDSQQKINEQVIRNTENQEQMIRALERIESNIERIDTRTRDIQVKVLGHENNHSAK